MKEHLDQTKQEASDAIEQNDREIEGFLKNCASQLSAEERQAELDRALLRMIEADPEKFEEQCFRIFKRIRSEDS